MKDNRCELIKGNIIIVAGKDYIVDSVIGRGASCICYKAYTKEAAMIEGKPEIKTWRVIKEFYPVNIAIRDSFMKVVPAFDDLTTWENSQKRWKEAVDKGREFQAQDGNNFMEIEVADLSYTVMRLREGMTLGNWVQKNIPAAQNDNSDDERVRTQYVVKCLNILRDLCACIEKYQGDGKIHFDVKPENIYILADNNDKIIVRLIDYDSLMTKEEFYKIAGGDGKISMYSTRQYYGEEVWSLRSDWKAAATDENVWKQVDVYALGKVLQYMLTGNADDTLFFDDDFEWFKDKDPVIKRTSSRRYVLNGFIKKATNVFGHRYSDASTVKFVVENILGLFHDNNFEMFDGSNKYRDELVPELMVDGISYVKHRGNAPIVQVFEEYCAKQNKNICVVAESGMGKSTALRKLFIDKILENQCVNRYYYCPLRDYAKSAPRVKKLWQDIKDSYGYPSCERQYFLLDAFDETNESDEGLQDALKYRLNAIPENAAVVLTSRFVVKDLRDYKIVACGKIGLTDYSDDIIRIKNNSDWLERVGIDIFQNPLFITMSENIEQIRHYIIHDKETGETAWKKIEKELLGEYVNGKLTINYAGELIWNYVYINMLKRWIHSFAFDDIVKLLDNYIFIEQYAKYDTKRYSLYSNKNALNNVCKTISAKIFLCDIIVRPKELEYILSTLNQMSENSIYFDIFFKAKYILTKNFSLLGELFEEVLVITKYTRSFSRELGLFNAYVFFALEMSGAIYNKIEISKGSCIGNIPLDIVKYYSKQIYLAGLKYSEESCVSLSLSSYQQSNRYMIYDWLKYGNKTIEYNGKRFRNLKNLIVNILLLSDFNVSFLNFSNCVINIRYFGTVQYCKFTNSFIQVLGGQFFNCRFENLKSNSILSEEVYKINYVDKAYEVADEFGNRYTICGDVMIQIKNYKMLNEKIKRKIKHVLPQAFENCIDDIIVFYSNVEYIDFGSYERMARELLSYDINSDAYNYGLKNAKLERPDRVIIYGNAYIVGRECVKYLEIYESSEYTYLDGVLYKDNEIIHVNDILPNEVRLLSIQYRGDNYDWNGCKKLILQKNIEETAIPIGGGFVLRSFFTNLEDIINLPKNICFIFEMLIDFRGDHLPNIINVVIGNYYSKCNIIYIPEDLGLIGSSGVGNLVRHKKKVFRPYLRYANDMRGKRLLKAFWDAFDTYDEGYLQLIQQSSASIPWDHTYDNFWGDRFKYPTILDCDRLDSNYDGLVIDAYDELTENEMIEVNEQRNKWIEYIKSLPPGKKYR